MVPISNILSKEYDYIIVGQGLAGTCLANEFLDRDKKVLVIDSPKMLSASRVAGGLFNPVTGRNMVLTWMAHDLFPFLTNYYTRLGKRIGAKILHFMPLFRPFASTRELNEWQGKSTDSRYSPFVDFISTTPYKAGLVKNVNGGIMFKQTGYLDTKLLLDNFRQLLREKEMLQEERFLTNNLNFKANSVVYKEYSAKKIFFCDGPSGIGNQFLQSIRFHPVKGEVLRLQLDERIDFILNRNAFVLPRDGEFLAGSNYNLADHSWEPTEDGKEEIVNKINKILNIKYTIIGQKAGIRPTTHDRRPVLGILPNCPQVGVFNGLGTKGVSLAPYFARQLTNHLLIGTEVHRDVHIGRYID